LGGRVGAWNTEGGGKAVGGFSEKGFSCKGGSDELPRGGAEGGWKNSREGKNFSKKTFRGKSIPLTLLDFPVPGRSQASKAAGGGSEKLHKAVRRWNSFRLPRKGGALTTSRRKIKTEKSVIKEQ